MKMRKSTIGALLLCLGAVLGCGSREKPMAGKADELMNLPTTEKLDRTKRIDGKVAVAEKYPNLSGARLEGLKPDGSIDILSMYFFSPERKAQSLDEIATLVKIDCRPGKVVSGTIRACDCDVSAIDYDTRTIFAKKKFENTEADEKSSGSDTLAAPSEAIRSYLRELSSYN